MEFFSTLVAGFGLAGVASAVPTVKPSTNSSLFPRDLADQATFCSDNAPATVNAIGQACGGLDGPLILGGPQVQRWASTGTYEDDPHAVTILIETICYDDPDMGRNNGPPTDESDNCMDILWSMCAASITTGPESGVFLKRGKNDCQKWVISGYKRDDGTFNYEDVKSVDMIVSDPGPGIPVDGSSSSVVRSVDNPTAQPASKKSPSTKRNTPVEHIPRSVSDQATLCSDRSPATVNAIGQLCGGLDGPLIIGANFVSYISMPQYDHSPHPVTFEVRGMCDGPEVLDESDNCMNLAWQMCAIAAEHDTEVVLCRGPNKCQQWLMAGWREDGNGFDWDNLMPVDDLVTDPANTPKPLHVRSIDANVTIPSASPPNTNTTALFVRDAIDPSSYCSDHSQALTAAIGQLCANDMHVTPFGTKGSTKSGVNDHEWTEEKSPGPNQAMIQVTNDCPFDVDAKDDCMHISWSLCQATIDNGYLGAQAATMEGGCLKWRIPGNGESNFRWDKMVEVEVDV